MGSEQQKLMLPLPQKLVQDASILKDFRCAECRRVSFSLFSVWQGSMTPPTEVAGSSKQNSEVQWNLNLREQKPSLQFGYSLHEGIPNRPKPCTWCC